MRSVATAYTSADSKPMRHHSTPQTDARDVERAHDSFAVMQRTLYIAADIPVLKFLAQLVEWTNTLLYGCIHACGSIGGTRPVNTRLEHNEVGARVFPGDKHLHLLLLHPARDCLVPGSLTCCDQVTDLPLRECVQALEHLLRGSSLRLQPRGQGAEMCRAGHRRCTYTG